jgi:hypothetical protein
MVCSLLGDEEGVMALPDKGELGSRLTVSWFHGAVIILEGGAIVSRRERGVFGS